MDIQILYSVDTEILLAYGHNKSGFARSVKYTFIGFFKSGCHLVTSIKVIYHYKSDLSL